MEKEQKNPDRKLIDDLDKKYATYKERRDTQKNKGSEEKKEVPQSVKKQDVVKLK